MSQTNIFQEKRLKTNIIKALLNIEEIINSNDEIILEEIYSGKNRMNNMGTALEHFCKDAFCKSYDIEKDKKINSYRKYLSYLGNSNNPPDFILRNGAGIEVKKIGSIGATLQLNSSFPKDSLHSDDSRIKKGCRNCEDTSWKKKDLIYAIGYVKKKRLKLLWLIDASLYAADREVYLDTFNGLKEHIEDSPYELNKSTNELARLNKVDPLGITSLRVRGMWLLDNPKNVYNYLDIDLDSDDSTDIVCLISKDKYNKINRDDLKRIENSSYEVVDIKIKDPNNPINQIDTKLIKK